MMEEPATGQELAGERSSGRNPPHPIKKQVRFADEVHGDVGESAKQEVAECICENRPRGVALVLIILALLLSTFICALDLTIVSTANPKISAEFGSLDQIGWYGSVYFTASAAFQHAWSQSYRQFRTKGVFVAAFAIFEMGSLLCGVAQTSTALLVGRALEGIGRTGILSGTVTMLTQIAPVSRRRTYSRVIEAVYGMATVAGPVLGGLLADDSSWRWCFFLDLPIGVLAAVIVLLFLRTVNDPALDTDRTWPQRIRDGDVFGLLALLSAMACYLMAMRWGGVTHSWRAEGVTFLVLGSAVGLLFVFPAIEWRMGDRAMLRLDLILDGPTLASLLYIFFLAGSYFALLYYLPLQSQSVDAVSATHSGLRLLPLLISMFLATLISDALIWRYGHHLLFLAVAPCFLLAGAVLMATSDVNYSAGYEILAGIGIGLAWHVPLLYNQSQVGDASHVLSITSMTLIVEHLGAAIFVTAGQTALMNTLVTTLPKDVPSLDIHNIIHDGATQWREKYTDPVTAREILNAYAKGARASLVVSVACAGLAAAVGLGIPGVMILKGTAFWAWIQAADGGAEAPRESGP